MERDRDDWRMGKKKLESGFTFIPRKNGMSRFLKSIFCSLQTQKLNLFCYIINSFPIASPKPYFTILYFLVFLTIYFLFLELFQPINLSYYLNSYSHDQI